MNRYEKMTSADAEERFRQIFFAHLEADGYSEKDAYRFLFKTPAAFHAAPTADHGLELIEAFRETYQRQLVHSWFFEGLKRKPASSAESLLAPERPVTFVVIPGIFGEFIEQVPFQSVIEKEDSLFRRKWQNTLDGIADEAYSVLDSAQVACRLSDVVKIGSIDLIDRSYANVIVMKPAPGSLETLGSLASNVAVLVRRMTKALSAIDDDTDIYLVGYSRGLAVSLELVSSLHTQSGQGELPPATSKWFARFRGVVSLGGVYYGTHFVHEVLTGTSGATSDLVRLLCETSGKLTTVPDDATLAEKREILEDNTMAWRAFVKMISEGQNPRVAMGKSFLQMDLEQVFARESKARIVGRDVPVPNPWGIFAIVSSFFIKTFNLKKFVSRYNQNIVALKELVEAVVVGIHTLTLASRDEWWRSHKLPENLVLFSVTGSMPEAYLNDFVSPLWHFEGYGTKTSDYNVSLRSAYFDTLASEKTLVNDSQVAHFCARYWEQMYPGHQYTHYYLGILGTHHWGMAFPFAIRDKETIGINAFPRGTMLKAVASFISSVNADSPGD